MSDLRSKGTRVRVTDFPHRTGTVVGSRDVNGQCFISVQMDAGGTSGFRLEDLEEIPSVPESEMDLFIGGQFGTESTLRRHLIFQKLNGRLADVIYSMGTTATDFYAHQFKPLLRFLETPARGILIADEVGLGKTIEAGLIWTEMRVREDYRRLLVVCPAHLRENWQLELQLRFGVEAEISSAGDLLSALEKARNHRTTAFAKIISFQGVLAPRNWQDPAKTATNNRAKLARFLDEIEEDDPILDLLIVDEAHYLRNRESLTSKTGRLLAEAAERMLLLSATPIMLGSQNLLSLLNLLEPNTFENEYAFQVILEGNAPLVKAWDILLRNENPDQQELIRLFKEAATSPLMRDNRQVAAAIETLSNEADFSKNGLHSKLIRITEGANLLSKVVNRTRKRDVQEARVERFVRAFKVQMNDAEKVLYKRVIQIVREYCRENVGQGSGLLYVMPERQTSSSMPAVLRYWQESLDQEDKDWEDLVDRLGDNQESDEDERPLLSFLKAKALALGNYRAFRQDDSKYNMLKEAFTEYFAENPGAKIVLFAYFRPTLAYLQERLKEDGYSCALIYGGMGRSKYDQLEYFARPDGPSILLSSEVGSEGINLQFASVIINFDLPWNPMRIEQRIGRLDRIGQKADKIQVWNFFAADTIDERIYERLLLRIGVFQHALGDTEEVIGSQISELTRELFTHDLSPEEEKKRIEAVQVVRTFNNVLEEDIESNAGNLVAYRDYILTQVNAIKDLQRIVTARDLMDFVFDYFRNRDEQTIIRSLDSKDHRFVIQLSDQTSYDLDDFLQLHGIPGTTRLKNLRETTCRFLNSTVPGSNTADETINQFHPLIRFISSKIEQDSTKDHPLAAVRCPANGLPLCPGIYCFKVERWSVAGIRSVEVLHFRIMDLQSGKIFGTEDSEEVLVHAARFGRHWQTPGISLNLDDAWSALEHQLSQAVLISYTEFASRIRNESLDRIDLQVRLIENHRKKKLAQLEQVRGDHSRAGRSSLAKAIEGKIRKLEDRINRQLHSLEQRRSISESFTAVCLGVLKLE